MPLHKHTFEWGKFQGSAEALKWNMRDLTSIDHVLSVVTGRTACVQAGGNLGVFAKYLSRFFGAVYTFEPAPKLFRHLNTNVTESNVIRLQVALGETPGLVDVACSRRGPRPGQVHEGLTHISGHGLIPTLRLDDLHLPVVDLLYLDLEGFELYAMRGALRTIARCRPVVAVEINQNAGFYGVEQDDVRGFLISRGYQFHSRVQSDEVFIPSDRECH